jgi:hypothetical protein
MDRPDTVQAFASSSESGEGPGSGAGGSAGPAGGRGAGPRFSDLATGSGPLAIDAAVVLPDSGEGTSYLMFEAVGVTPEGATLRGGLLLEVNEEVTLELRLPDRNAFRARARVVEIVHGRPPAMKVVWTSVHEGDRRPDDR